MCMIPKKRGFWTIFLTILCLNISGFTQAQTQADIFSVNNSFIYVQHLVKTQEFGLAAEALKMLLSNDTIQKNRAVQDSVRFLIGLNYRKSAQFDSAIVYIFPLHKKNTTFYKEYIQILLLQKRFDFILEHIEKEQLLTEASKELIKLDVFLLQGNWKKAALQLEKVQIGSMEKVYAYNAIVDKGLDAPRKKIWLGVLMSAVVPGLGKVYAKQYWEGIFTFSETALFGFGATHVFYQKGTSDVLGWTLAGVAGGFYAGNIYGTIKTIKKYNQKIQNAIIKDAEGLVFTND